MKKKLHIVGTHGVPAKYGGFETLADFLCQNLSNKYEITVYCSSNLYIDKPREYQGAFLAYIPLNASGASGIVYDFITYIVSLFKADVILYLSPVGSGFMTPLNWFANKKVLVNHGGLNEWEREKLNWAQKKWAKFNHWIAARFADVNIVDNDLYRLSLKSSFGVDSQIIRYGGDHVFVNNTELFIKKYPFVKEKYGVSVSRAQIDNNLHIVLDAFVKVTKFPLVLISNWQVSAYGRELKAKYKDVDNLILLDAIYDKQELDFLRGNATVYIHSHSRCGTAPSLVEAMCLGRPIVSFDVGTNRETTEGKAMFFCDSTSLQKLINESTDEEYERRGKIMKEIALRRYRWKHISDQYSQLID